MANRTNKMSRNAARAAMLRAALCCEIENHYDIAVIGGGAAGLVSAIHAADPGHKTLLLEADLECGKKILATGNGRCNLTNIDLDTCHYSHPDYVAEVFQDRPYQKILEFFQSCALMCCEEQGRIYPRSLQAASVQEVLLHKASQKDITIGCARMVQTITYDKKRAGYIISYQEQGEKKLRKNVFARACIITTGGGVCLKMPGIDIPLTKTSPCLCALSCTTPPPKKLSGRRLSCEACLVRKNKIVACEVGEVMFRDYGLTGIAIFNLSRHAQPKDTIILNPFYDMKVEEVEAHLKLSDDLQTSLAGCIDPVIAQHIIKSRKNLNAKSCAKLLCHMEFEVSGKANIGAAQVTQGGYRPESFDPSTMMAHDYPGLFCAGEALDIDADCGGYNLSWAWLSAMTAGTAAKTYIRSHTC